MRGGDTEYYDLRADPYELRNRSADPLVADRIAVLRSRLAALKRDADAGAVPDVDLLPGDRPLLPPDPDLG